MKQWIKDIWHDPVWSNVIASAIFAIIGFVLSLFWSRLSEGNTLEETLKLVFGFQINFWLALAVVMFLLIARGIILRRKQNRDRIPVPPFVTDFTWGVYQGQKWTWRWQWCLTYKFYYIADLSMICPVCKEGLITLEFTNYKCGKCGADIPYNMINANDEAVEKQIMDDARKRYDYCAEYIGKLPQPIIKV